MERSPYGDDIEETQGWIDKVRSERDAAQRRVDELLAHLQRLKQLDAQRQGHLPTLPTGENVGLVHLVHRNSRENDH